MLNIDLTAFLTQNTAFYAGFVIGLFLGAYIAYLFFKTSLRYFKEHITHLKDELEREQKNHQLVAENYKNAFIFQNEQISKLSQQINKQNDKSTPN